ncbi:PDZ domain-containing protein [Kineococcus gynurae]|uniref:PDZ domain-containing protein n=1 Tax=Kineococcus gynurae TaxID=452979 RepID=A0ABV5LN79_9ACTN
MLPQDRTGPDESSEDGSSERDDRAGVSPRGLLLGCSAVLSLLLVSVVSLLPAPYVTLSPGPVVDVIGTEVPAAATAATGTSSPSPSPSQGSSEGLITVRGAPVYPTEGSLDLTTVAVLGGPGDDLDLWQALQAWLDPRVAVAPRSVYYPEGQSAKDAAAASVAQMTGSQTAAKVAALRELGEDVPATVTLRVGQLATGAPAAEVLRVGDEIRAVDGRPVADFEALRVAVEALRPGAEVRLTVRRDGATQELTTRTVAVDGATRLGVAPEITYDFPFDVELSLENIGGPSAGTMFALGIVDVLTPGAMTGGQHVAGTGSITPDGVVGVIGGLRQKVIGARADGARWFLAPAAECPQVAGATPEGITVVPITTLHQAREAVETIGAGRGESLPTCG